MNDSTPSPMQDDSKEIPAKTRLIPNYECTCGRVIASNIGRLSHRKKCDGRYLSSAEQYSTQQSTQREA